ncbi:MAG: hypothetical protein NTX25_08265, partial [Proteobacteria bacterium]|nr:hypothetical protein [Pseudomonadota bacterium]
MILNYKRIWLFASLVTFSLSIFGACKTEEKLPALGDSIAGPVDVASSPSGQYFYVLNSDYERKFNQGSLMVIDPNDAAGPRKLQTIPTQRLGRSLDVAQNLLLSSYDAVDAGKPRLVELSIDCSPLNAVLAPKGDYFAVSCIEGQLYMGHLNRSNMASSTLDLVRSYGYARHALYFYEGSAGTKFLAFPTDVDLPDASDFSWADIKHYDISTATMLSGANEVPDALEETVEARRRPGVGYPYQMVIYDVSAEEKATAADAANEGKHFRFLELGTFTKPTQANRELRYVYFTLSDLDGGPSSGEQTTDINARSYRSNFWATRPSLEASPEVFYLSQRGNTYGSTSNNILKLTINAAALN